MNGPRLWTVGHSSQALDDLVALLRGHGIETVVDVRAFPHSRRNPQFDREALEVSVLEAGIAYQWFGKELGGYRKNDRSDSPHTALGSFRSYADHMESAAFRIGIARLLAIENSSSTALLCAERDWTHCHRRLISDHLVAIERGSVFHIVDETAPEPHRLDARAHIEAGTLIYDLGQQTLF